MISSINQSTLMCPNCTSTLLSANKRRFNGANIVLDSLYNPLGLSQGTNDIVITCLQCGITFNPGEGASSTEEIELKKRKLEERKVADASNKMQRYFVVILLIIVTCACLCAYFISIT